MCEKIVGQNLSRLQNKKAQDALDDLSSSYDSHSKEIIIAIE